MSQTLWAFLLFAHFLGDYPLQGDFLANTKKDNLWHLFAHGMIWAGCVSIALFCFNEFSLFKFHFLVLGHMIIDKFKADFEWKYSYFLDQSLHICQLVLVGL